MRTRAGLWIDHSKCVIVMVTDDGKEMDLTLSKVERRLRPSGDSPHHGRHESQKVPADDIRQRVFTGHLNTYYDEVITCLQDAEAILIFGPGEAKGELNKRLKRDHLGARIAGVEGADKMTDRQIAAKVREHFAVAAQP